MKIKYYLFILLLAFCACSSSTDVEPPPTPPGGDDSSSVSSVEPLSVALPRADFTELSKIKRKEHSKIVTQRLIDLIDATPEDASVYLSPDRIGKNMDGIINAIRRADIRGVDLHIMLDMSSAANRKGNSPTIKRLKLIDSGMDLVKIHIAPDGNGVNHNKFDLFSKIKMRSGELKNVVFTTSQNMFRNAETKIQNAITLSDSGLYQAYLSYWQEMKQKRTHKGKKNYTFRKYSDPDNGIYALFYPKTKNGQYFDPVPIANVLDKITNPSSTTIKIAMAGWDNCYIDVVKKLSDLMEQGAKVEVVTRSSASKKVHDWLVNLANRGAFIKMYNYDRLHNNVKKIRTHSKEMIIDGKWKGNKTNVIVTGSENFNCADLKRGYNNDVILSSHNFGHQKIFKRYEDNFDKIKKLPGVCCMKND